MTEGRDEFDRIWWRFEKERWFLKLSPYERSQAVRAAIAVSVEYAHRCVMTVVKTGSNT